MGITADKTEVISPDKAVIADFIATDRSDLLVAATNSFLFPLIVRINKELIICTVRDLKYPVMEFTDNRLLC